MAGQSAPPELFMTPTPRDLGFRMPAETAPHAGCWLLWPERADTWRADAAPAEAAFAAVAAAIARFEPLTVGVSAARFDRCRAQLPPQVRVMLLPYNDAWIRDNGPTFLTDEAGTLAGVDWTFNAWGGHYADYADDDRLAAAVLAACGARRFRSRLTTEGGALHVDGEGTLLLTRTSLLDPRRNPDWSETQIAAELRAMLGVETLIWIDEGVYNDETAGHIDNLCCFVRPGLVALTWTDDAADPQYALSRAAMETLRAARDARGRRLEIVPIQQPTPLIVTAAEVAGRRRPAGTRLAGSYINFYIANGGIIMPAFGDRHDEPAQEMLRQLFPEREVVAVQSREILLGGGNIHCITQQQPGGAP